MPIRLRPKHLTISEAIRLRKQNPTKNRRPENRELENFKKIKYEGWSYCDGGFHRYKKIYSENLNNKPLNFILNDLKVHDPQVMILGPGKGHDSAILKSELQEFGVNLNIDTLGYSKTIDKELLIHEIIRKDYSPHISKATAFEHINQIEHPKIAKEIIGKYHLIIAERSIGVYGKSKSYAIFQTSLLLAKGGRAYIDLDYNKPIKQIIDITKRMIHAYNKTNKQNLEFKIQEIKELSGKDKETKYTYIQIDRLK